MKISEIRISFIEIPNHVSLAFYTVGCPHNCPGCCNKLLQNELTAPTCYEMDILSFLIEIKNYTHLIDSIVWLGGDAYFQKDELLNMSMALKKEFPNFINCLYTGYFFNEISNEHKKYLDIIVDGKWEGKTISHPETNQKIYIKENNKWKNITYEELKKYEK